MIVRAREHQRPGGVVLDRDLPGTGGEIEGLAHRAAVLLGTLAVVAVSVFAFLIFPPTRLQNELIPEDDRGFFLIVVRGPEGASLPYTDGYVRQVEQIIGRTPDVNGYFTIVGGLSSKEPNEIIKNLLVSARAASCSWYRQYPQTFFLASGVNL